MKKGWIVLGSAMLLLLPVSACMGVWAQDDHSVQSVQSVQSVKYPEPPRSKDVPGHLVWNEDTGAYYDPEEFEWDPVNRVYKEKFIIDDRPIPDEWLEPVDEWIKRHENSKNPVEQALVKFYKLNFRSMK